MSIFYVHANGDGFKVYASFFLLLCLFLSVYKIAQHRIKRNWPTLFDVGRPLFDNHGVAGLCIMEN